MFNSVLVSRRAVVLVGLWVVGLPAYALIYARLHDGQGVWPISLTVPSDIFIFFSGGMLYFFFSWDMPNSCIRPKAL